MLCKHCGGYRHGPCEDCHDGECTMNCGPAMIDVRGIFDAADAEWKAADNHGLFTPAEGQVMRIAVSSMMVRLGLYKLWQQCRAPKEPQTQPTEAPGMTRPGDVIHDT